MVGHTSSALESQSSLFQSCLSREFFRIHPLQFDGGERGRICQPHTNVSGQFFSIVSVSKDPLQRCLNVLLWSRKIIQNFNYQHSPSPSFLQYSLCYFLTSLKWRHLDTSLINPRLSTHIMSISRWYKLSGSHHGHTGNVISLLWLSPGAFPH